MSCCGVDEERVWRLARLRREELGVVGSSESEGFEGGLTREDKGVLTGEVRVRSPEKGGWFVYTRREEEDEREEDLFSPLQAEAVALRAGLSWAIHRGFQHISFESDSLYIVEASCDSSPDLSFIGQIVEDIKVLFHSITEDKITHTHCQANSIAHRLARVGLSEQQDCIWDVTPPSIVTDLLVEDNVLP
ncbi:hypothetical protein DVH24_023183 [Malus domestica]|uniref:RNase H type-1 domain-containing protein n=1 Tax=Malus domestica TaxID=3750 RepID=A0A498KLK8_MALDO|nr:hypothetical protein DVH24_023183 [Malus domestica]